MGIILFYLEKAGFSLCSHMQCVAWPRDVGPSFRNTSISLLEFQSWASISLLSSSGSVNYLLHRRYSMEIFRCRIHSCYLDLGRWWWGFPNKQVKSSFPEAKGLKLEWCFSHLYSLSTLCNQPRGCYWDHCCYDNIDKWVGFQRRAG